MSSRWHALKEAANIRKHGVDFAEADTIFDDMLVLVIDDPRHSHVEARYIAIGESKNRRLLVVSYTIREDDPWLISARTAEPRERRWSMASDIINDKDDDMLPCYDFSQGVRGKHYRGKPPHTVVAYRIDADVAAYFPTEDDVDKALRMLIAEGRSPVKKVG